MAGELFFFLRRRLSFLAFGLKNANFGKNVNDVVIERGDKMGMGGGGSSSRNPVTISVVRPAVFRLFEIMTNSP